MLARMPEPLRAIILVLCMGLCSCGLARYVAPCPAEHWVRSDDYGEYHGLYVYSQTPDGKLWFTHYPERSAVTPERPRHCGYWEIDGDTLIWTDLHRKPSIEFTRNEKGVYVEQDGHYYHPVELIHVPMEDGKVQLE